MPAAKKTAKPKAATKTTKTKTAKPKLRAVKAKVVAKTKQTTQKTASAPKAAPKNVKSLAAKRASLAAGTKTKAPAKPHQASAPAQGTNVIWKLLEARKLQKEQRSNENGQSPHQQEGRDSRNKLHNQKHARFGRFAGPRRKAA